MLLTASGLGHGRPWPRGQSTASQTTSRSTNVELTDSNQFMKVQLAKLKADQEKAGKKGDHRVSQPPRA